MEELYNHYSFLWIAVGLTIVAGLVLLTNKPRLRDFLSFGVIVAGLFVAWLILHPQQTPLMNDAKISAGHDRRWHAGSARIPIPLLNCLHRGETHRGWAREGIGLRNYMSCGSISRSRLAVNLAPVYDFEYTPTYIFFDAQGNELWRTIGEIDPQRVRDSVAKQ